MSRADEELQGAEDKLNHLSMVKSKLEQTLDDLEDTLEREKRSKADAEKTMRKMETDMKVHLLIVLLTKDSKKVTRVAGLYRASKTEICTKVWIL